MKRKTIRRIPVHYWDVTQTTIELPLHRPKGCRREDFGVNRLALRRLRRYRVVLSMRKKHRSGG